MTLLVESGVLTIDDNGGTEVFNSSTDQLFHCLPSRVDGSVSRSSSPWSSGGLWFSRTADTSVGTLPTGSTHIAGLVQVSYSGGYTYLPSGAWFVAGGSFVLIHKRFQSISGTWGDGVSSIALATIYNSGTDLRFKEHIKLRDDTMSGAGFDLDAYTLNFRIFGAVFS